MWKEKLFLSTMIQDTGVSGTSSETDLCAQKIISFITNFNLNRSIVHTSLINKKISNLFKSNGIIYLEKNLNNNKIAISTIFSLIKPLFTDNKIGKRSFLRIDVLPNNYKISICHANSDNPPITGFLKNLSLNGMCIIKENIENFKKFNLRDLLELKINFHKIIITIIGRIILDA